VHPDGRTFLLEIVILATGILAKKFAQVRRAESNNLILAISERLNLRKLEVKVSDVPARVVQR